MLGIPPPVNPNQNPVNGQFLKGNQVARLAKGKKKTPKPIEVLVRRIVKQEIAKQSRMMKMAEDMASPTPLIENQRNSKLQKQRAKRIERKQQFTDNAKLLSSVTQTPGFVRRVDKTPGMLIERPK